MEATARCGCGALEVLVSGSPVAQMVCHCRDCQSFTGLACVEGVFFKNVDCQIEGQSNVDIAVGGTGAKKFHHTCSACGDPVYVQVQALNNAIAIGADRLSPFEFVAEAHIWTSEKVSDSHIPPDLPQSTDGPPPAIVARLIRDFWQSP
jgi:hypothetical protein